MIVDLISMRSFIIAKQFIYAQFLKNDWTTNVDIFQKYLISSDIEFDCKCNFLQFDKTNKKIIKR